MQTNHETLLCRYHYDALDRLAVCTPAEQASTGRFYQKNRLATEIQGLVQHSIFQYDDQLLAQHQRQGGTVATTLLITDQQRSVLNAPDATPPRSVAYTPYGHHPVGNGLLSLLGFNGERPDPVTGHYHLGNGYRQFNPGLMRFNSPDSWSPFGKGGINAYAYCAGNPINRTDPTGHLVKQLVQKLQGHGEHTKLFRELYGMKLELGGAKNVRAAAKLAGTTPEQYLLGKTIDNMKGKAQIGANSNYSRVSTQSTIEGVIEIFDSAVKELSSFKSIRNVISGAPELLSKEASASLSAWAAELQGLTVETIRITNDKVIGLERIQSGLPPLYSLHDPLATSQPSAVGNNIRQS